MRSSASLSRNFEYWSVATNSRIRSGAISAATNAPTIEPGDVPATRWNSYPFHERRDGAGVADAEQAAAGEDQIRLHGGHCRRRGGGLAPTGLVRIASGAAFHG